MMGRACPPILLLALQRQRPLGMFSHYVAQDRQDCAVDSNNSLVLMFIFSSQNKKSLYNCV